MLPTLPHLIRNLLAASVSLVGSRVWTNLLSFLVREKKLSSRSARKLMHISTAPLFTLTWPLYSPIATTTARCLAAAVPFSFAVRIIATRSDPLSRAVLRHSTTDTPTTGNVTPSRDTGPSTYGIAVACVTAATWTNHAATYVALSALCIGDAMGDLIGSAVNKWPISIMPMKLSQRVFGKVKRKTLPGSIACFVSSLLVSLAWIAAPFPLRAGPSQLPVKMQRVVMACAAATAVELVPIEDNFLVPLAAFLVMIAGNSPNGAKISL